MAIIKNPITAVKKGLSTGSVVINCTDAYGNIPVAYTNPDGSTQYDTLAAGSSHTITNVFGSPIIIKLPAGNFINSYTNVTQLAYNIFSNPYVYYATTASGAIITVEQTCLLGDTPVVMNDGSTKDIENVSVGDKVYALVLDGGERKSVEVLRVFSHDYNGKIITLKTADGEKIISGTGNHPIFAVEEESSGGKVVGKYVELGEIKVGDNLYSEDGGIITVGRVEESEYSGKVYNLDVSEPDNYFAGTMRILCHNKPE